MAMPPVMENLDPSLVVQCFDFIQSIASQKVGKFSFKLYEAQSSVGIKRGQMTGLNASVFAGLNAQKQMDGMENSCKTII